MHQISTQKSNHAQTKCTKLNQNSRSNRINEVRDLSSPDERFPVRRGRADIDLRRVQTLAPPMKEEGIRARVECFVLVLVDRSSNRVRKAK